MFNFFWNVQFQFSDIAGMLGMERKSFDMFDFNGKKFLGMFSFKSRKSRAMLVQT